MRTWKQADSFTMRYSPRGSGACGRCKLIPPRPGSPRHPAIAQAGTTGRLLHAARAVRIQRVWPTPSSHPAAYWLDCRASRCRAPQTLATRAYRALNRVCLGKAKRVRFKSRSRGLSSIENKRNNTGMRFVLQAPKEGNAGWLLWGNDHIPAVISWNDPVVHHGLGHKIKYARLVRRAASSPRAQGADREGNRYYVQLILEGTPYQKPKNAPGIGTIGLDIGPSTIAIVPRAGEVTFKPLCEELAPEMRKKRRLQRQMDRQRRVNNPEHYDAQGRVKTHGKRHLKWRNSKRYLATRREIAKQERKLAAHRKSLHGKLVHDIVCMGNQVHIEKTSFQGWQQLYGKSVGLRAPGMLVGHLRRTVAKTGGTLIEVPTYHTKLSQYCHGCKTYTKKPLSERWHECACGIGPIQRDLYSACLLAYLDPKELIPSIAHEAWEGAELRLRAARECLQERASAGESFPQSMGLTRAGARRLKSLANPSKSVFVFSMGTKRWVRNKNPRSFKTGSLSLSVLLLMKHGSVY
jgi:hypothetical protein